MRQCPKCAAAVPEEAFFCPHCGFEQPAGPTDPQPQPTVDIRLQDIHRLEWLAFVGQGKAPYYFPRFYKLIQKKRFTFTWNWAACFAISWWFLYRKMYLWAVVFFFPAFFFSIPTMIVSGFMGNYLYFLEVRKKIIGIKKANPGPYPLAELAKAGGVNEWAFWAGSVFFFCLPSYTRCLV